jgi:4-carboxymuconolactone decarboxylase
MDEIKGDSVGLETYRQVFGEPNERPLTGLRQITIDHLFGDIWSRPGLSLRNRRVITIASLAAQGVL